MIVYIACPAYAVSGGAELLHQFSAELCARNIETYMIYYGVVEGKKPTPDRYLKYGVQITDKYIDTEESVLVLPEVGVQEVAKCVKGKAIIWWLSVNNYIMSYRQYFKTTFDIFGIAGRNNVFNFVQSQYAKDFLQKFFHIENSYFLSDFINEEIIGYAKEHNGSGCRKNICVYNPAKGLANIEPLISASRDDIEWVALQGFTPLQMAEMLCSAKVYIDFGGHPGKDRIPREAAICGCCVITNREGSAANSIDVMIPEKYKFGAINDVNSILQMVYDIIDEYDKYIDDFAGYRIKIENEKAEFSQEVDRFVELLTEGIK